MLAQALCGTAVGVLLGAGLDQNVRDDLSHGIYRWTGVRSKMGSLKDLQGLRLALDDYDPATGAPRFPRHSTALVTVTLVSFSSGLAVGWLFSGQPGSRAEQFRKRIAASVRLKDFLASGALSEAYGIGKDDDLSALTWNLFSSATSRGCELVKSAQESITTVNREISATCYSICQKVATHVQPIVDWAAALLHDPEEDEDTGDLKPDADPNTLVSACKVAEQPATACTPECSEADLALLENFTAELLQHESNEEAHAVEAKLEAELEQLRETGGFFQKFIGSFSHKLDDNRDAPVARSPARLMDVPSTNADEEVFQVVPTEIAEEDLSSSLLMDYEVIGMPGKEDGSPQTVLHV